MSTSQNPPPKKVKTKGGQTRKSPKWWYTQQSITCPLFAAERCRFLELVQTPIYRSKNKHFHSFLQKTTAITNDSVNCCAKAIGFTTIYCTRIVKSAICTAISLLISLLGQAGLGNPPRPPRAKPRAHRLGSPHATAQPGKDPGWPQASLEPGKYSGSIPERCLEGARSIVAGFAASETTMLRTSFHFWSPQRSNTLVF